MRKIVAAILLCGLALTANAVPARHGWQTRTQADGTTIEVQVMGDEFYHYTINRDGKRVRLNEAGMYEVVGDAPSAAQARARRAAAKKVTIRKAKKEFGYTPNLAPRGIVIMVNFQDQSFASSNTRVKVDSLCNAKNCKVNKDGSTMYPSAGQYFKDQSNGAYAPVFDVYGPVLLNHNMEYYGSNDVAGNDIRPVNMLVEACKKVDSLYNVDFTQYDSDSDGKIDFVYILYAGEGEATGGADETIWPHSYSVDEMIEVDDYYTSRTGAREWRDEYGEAYVPYFSNEYSLSDCFVDGKQINTYACSNELISNSLAGIGTLCHEFSHVMGLPDFYETSYGVNSDEALTPSVWDIMDAGSYNGNGHCPPNYSAWEKYFFGWHTPINLGDEGDTLKLYANGTANYQAYQITTGSTLVGPTDSLANDAAVYYIENRQSVGWDRGLPYYGMLIWQIKYSRAAWKDNSPNNEDYQPRYTLVSASGTKIGTWYEYDDEGYPIAENDDSDKNPYPGSANVTSTTIAGKPLLNITKSGQVIKLTYIEVPVAPVDPFDVVFMAYGQPYDTVVSTGKLVLPATDPVACSDGRIFMGWCTNASYSSETTAPTFAKAGQAVQEGTTFYAVFANEDGQATVITEVVDDLTRATTGVSGNQYTSWSGKTVTSNAVYAGKSAGGNESIQLRTRDSEEGVITTASGGKLTKVQVVWNTNTQSGRKLDVYGKKSAYSSASDLYGNNAGTKLGTIEYGQSTSLTVSGDYTYVGVRSNASALWLEKLSFTWKSEGSGVSYSNYGTACASGTGIAHTSVAPKAQKIMENGHVLILRDGIRYTLLGQPVR